MPRLIASDDAGIRTAAERIREGGVVAFPTETVYGLGAGTLQPPALRAVYAMKGRPSDNPLIAHVIDAMDARRLVKGWDRRCSRLAAAFWPGPLTLILPRGDSVPDEAVAGLPTIAVRSPMHPVARSLLYAVGGPVSAPSANLSGHVSPTTSAHVLADFADADDLLVLEGGRAGFGIESTVLDLAGDRPIVRRPGSVTLEALRRLLGDVEVAHATEQGASPGTSLVHYAPDVPATMVPSARLGAFLGSLQSPAAVLAMPTTEVRAPHVAIRMQPDAEGYARMLYSGLREAEATGLSQIVIEEPAGRDGVWLAVLDRLRRATVR
jgi:L-threonylcarbamoyladenylate synthase